MANGQFLSEEQREILRKSSMCAKLNAEQCAYFFEVVERARLDPFLGQIRPDIRKTTQEDGSKEPTLLIITTLQGLRTIGDRSGQHDGESAPEWCDTEGNWRDVWLVSEAPVAARASIFRKDRERPQTCVCRWDAFVQKTYDKAGNTVPNVFWKRMGSHMLAKCSLAGAYRGMYPNLCSGLYITEELSEELDRDSEESIEAEMVRRARQEKEYWDKQRGKGIIAIDEQQRLAKAAGVNQAPVASPRRIELPESSVPPAPPVMMPAEALVNQFPPAAPVVPPAAPRSNWRDFVITRIQLFKGRKVETLTAGELLGLKSFLDKVETGWGKYDQDFKDHYTAIKARFDYESQRELEFMGDGLDFGPT